MNGADIYVARFTKSGMTGSAAPCWRCLEWCRWAGVKRIFHWNADEGGFDVVKVNNPQGGGMYETHADVRLFAGLVRGLLLSCVQYTLLTSDVDRAGEVVYHGYTLNNIIYLVSPTSDLPPDNCSAPENTTGEGVTNAGNKNQSMHAQRAIQLGDPSHISWFYFLSNIIECIN